MEKYKRNEVTLKNGKIIPIAYHNQKDVVDNGYGFNYIQSAINKSTSSVTKYSVNEQNTPYKVSESID